MGKGSGRRPMNVTRKEFDDQWNRIFQKEKGDEVSRNPVSKNAGINRASTHRSKKTDYDRKDKWDD